VPSEDPHQASSSIGEGNENVPNDGASSSQSRPSAGEAIATVGSGTSERVMDSLEQVIHDALGRTDPESADELFHLLKGQVEYFPQEYSIDVSSPLSMLELVRVQASEALMHNGALTYAPSSYAGQSNTAGSSSSSSSSKEISAVSGSSSSAAGGNDSGGSADRGNRANGHDAGDDSGFGQPHNNTTSASNAVPSGQDKPRFPLRCIHNALRPDIYCVNHQTGDKYRTCGGPGLKNVAHLKEVSRLFEFFGLFQSGSVTLAVRIPVL
jgi:hypothetical protein